MTPGRPFAVVLGPGTGRANHTGSWRVERPVYVDRLPPCNDACPAGEDIQGWLFHAESRDYEAAWRSLVEHNPLPAVMGRVCFSPCQGACNRGRLDEAVGINAVERFLGDRALEAGWALPGPGPDTGRRVLVAGGGPAGLSAAYHLRRRGHAVVLADGGDEPGGMMRYGIPRYRLPRDVLAAEVDRILALGVELHRGTPVTDLAGALAGESDLGGGFDAAFVAVGAQRARWADLPAGDSARILDAVTLLRDTEAGDPPRLGRRVAVYGGGDTAMDAARTARRLGATDTVVVYRRTRARMPAHDVEVEQAEAEGVAMHWLSTVTAVEPGRLRLERMDLDQEGRPQPTGEFEELDADALVLALGQDTDLSLLEGMDDVAVSGGLVAVDAQMATGRPFVYAGGDVVGGERTVTTAVGHGKKAASAIDAALSATAVARPARHELARFERLNTWYYADAPRAVQPQLEAARRATSFDEVVAGLDEDTALFEARRCLSCGNCFQCDNCFGVCPDDAVRKLPGGGYAFDYDYCKGCGLCVAECPCGAITMVPEAL